LNDSFNQGEIVNKLLMAVLISLPGLSLAESQIPVGSQKQESCGFVGRDVRQGVWTIEGRPNRDLVTAKNKLIPIGKNVAAGDAIFYVNVTRDLVQTLYQTNVDILFKSTGFFKSSDLTVSKGTQFSEFGIFQNSVTNVKYPLVRVNEGNTISYLAAVKENGFLCADLIYLFKQDGIRDTNDRDVYESEPLIKSDLTSPYSDETIAITLVHLEDISATLAVKLIRGGQVVGQKELQLDSMSGEFQIEGLKVAFTKTDKSSIKITSIVEPSNYASWVGTLKLKLGFK
jgi:hypothetical protein